MHEWQPLEHIPQLIASIGLLVPSLLDGGSPAPATPGSPFLAVAPGTPGRTPQVRFS